MKNMSFLKDDDEKLTKSYMNNKNRESAKPIDNEVISEVKDLITALMDKSKKTKDAKIIDFARTIVLELGFTFVLTGTTSMVDIKQIYKIANEFFPEDLEILLYLARIYIHTEDNDNAEKVYTEILEKYPNHPIASKALKKLDLEKLKNIKMSKLDLSEIPETSKPVEKESLDDEIEDLLKSPEVIQTFKKEESLDDEIADLLKIPEAIQTFKKIPQEKIEVKAIKKSKTAKDIDIMLEILSDKKNFRTITILKNFIKDKTQKDVVSKKRAEIEKEGAALFISTGITSNEIKDFLKLDKVTKKVVEKPKITKKKVTTKKAAATKKSTTKKPTQKTIQQTIKKPKTISKKKTPKKEEPKKVEEEKIFTPRKEVDWLIMTNQEIKDAMAKFKTTEELKTAANSVLKPNDMQKRSRKAIERLIIKRIKER